MIAEQKSEQVTEQLKLPSEQQQKTKPEQSNNKICSKQNKQTNLLRATGDLTSEQRAGEQGRRAPAATGGSGTNRAGERRNGLRGLAGSPTLDTRNSAAWIKKYHTDTNS